MTYAKAMAFLQSFTNYETLPASAYQAGDFQLERVAHLLARLGSPQHGRLTVHVAGTKGKGSTAAMVASVLSQAGYRTGLYTSPHLVDFRERIRVDGAPVGEEAVAAAITLLAPEVNAYHRDARWGRLTTYELTTLTAFLCFRAAGATAQVLEVGLGGRLDATNVVVPDLCIITPVSYDHTEVLGDTLTAIAGEKAGIIKPGVPVVMGPQEDEAAAVIVQRAAEQDALLVHLARDYRWHRLEHDLDGQWLWLSTPMGVWELRVPLLGAVQLDNAAAAVAGLEVLQQQGHPIAPEHVVAGLEDVLWPGRLQVVERRPLLVVDGAHNGASARALAGAVRYDLPHRRLVLVIGTARDKDQQAIAAALAPVAGLVMASAADSPRASTPDELAAVFAGAGAVVQTAPDVGSALTAARAAAGPDDLILVTGSLVVAGEALQVLGRAADAAFATQTARRTANAAQVFPHTTV